MNRQMVSAVVLAGVVGFVAYLAYTGVTVNSAFAWAEQQLGIRVRKVDLQSTPHPGYAPITLPGR